MAIDAKTLFESATGRGRVIRQIDIACIVMDGAGAVVVPMQDLMQAQKWAQSKPPSSNLLSDRGRFLEQFNVMIARPGTQQGTRGNERQLEKLASAMKQAGYDLSEWTLPQEFKDPNYWMKKNQPPETPKDKKKTEADDTPEPSA